MKKFILNLVLFILPILIIIVIILFAPYDKKYAYNYLKGDYKEAAWIYNRIFESKTPIDIAFIGTSHTRNGVNDSLIEYNLNNKYQEPLKIANLGLSHFGENVHYTIVKDLLKSKKIKVLVFEVREIESRFSHFAFPILGDIEDVSLPVLFFNPYIFRDYSYALQSRYAYLSHTLLKEDNIVYRKISNNYGFSPKRPVYTTDELIKKRKKEGPLKLFYLGENMKEMEFRFAKEYINKIYELTKDHNVKMVFLYLPSYDPPVNKPVEYEFYKQMGEVWFPPDSILSNPSNWSDSVHLHPKAANQVAEWLAYKLSHSEVAESN